MGKTEQGRFSKEADFIEPNAVASAMPRLEISEDVLIRSALAGDQRAYETLWKKYQGLVKMVVSRHCFEKDDVEDLVQETFIKAFRALGGYSCEYSLKTWLGKIAQNNCIDRYRNRRVRPQTLSIDTPSFAEADVLPEGEGFLHEIPCDKQDEADYPILAEERRAPVVLAMNRLPDKYKTPMILRYDRQMEYQEIADRLGEPLGTVKAHLFRAKQLMAEGLSMNGVSTKKAKKRQADWLGLRQRPKKVVRRRGKGRATGVKAGLPGPKFEWEVGNG